jgi:excisionase family DNA binding protein
MSEAQTIHLTVAQVAERLGMTPDGVYKLIQRGKLAADRVSERKTRVSQDALDQFVRTQQNAVRRFRAATPAQNLHELRERFEVQTGRSPESWLKAWKSEELDDTPESMQVLVRAIALRGNAKTAPIMQPAAYPWAAAAFGTPQLAS